MLTNSLLPGITRRALLFHPAFIQYCVFLSVYRQHFLLTVFFLYTDISFIGGLFATAVAMKIILLHSIQIDYFKWIKNI